MRFPGSLSNSHLRTVFLAAFVALTFAAVEYQITGLGGIGRHYFQASQDPLREDHNASFMRESLLLPVLAHAVGANQSPSVYRLFVVSFYWWAVFALFFVWLRRGGYLIAFLMLTFLLVYPTSMIVYRWPGRPDALTFLFTAILMTANSRALIFFASILATLNHPAMWPIISSTVLAFRYTFVAKTRDLFMSALTGFLLGLITVKTTLFFADIQIARSRWDWGMDFTDFRTLKTILEKSLWRTTYSLYFAHLLIIPLLAYRLGRRNWRACGVFVGTQVLALAVSLMTFEITRVFTFLNCGVVLLALEMELLKEQQGDPRSLPLKWCAIGTIILSFILPREFSRAGDMLVASEFFAKAAPTIKFDR